MPSRRLRRSPSASLRPEALRERVVGCELCPRLVNFRRTVSPRRSFSSETYWRRPVPGFGDIEGRLLVLGLAPAAHGGNRTGRVFTGDASGRFLVNALHKGGFANQPVSESVSDGLVYSDCYLTAAVKCAPPGDRPTPEEFENCSAYLDEEVAMMRNLRAVLALGALSFRAYIEHLQKTGSPTSGLRFSHGASYRLTDGVTLWASYHPSPRNTNTGRLTEDMLASVISMIARELGKEPSKHN